MRYYFFASYVNSKVKHSESCWAEIRSFKRSVSVDPACVWPQSNRFLQSSW